MSKDDFPLPLIIVFSSLKQACPSLDPRFWVDSERNRNPWVTFHFGGEKDEQNFKFRNLTGENNVTMCALDFIMMGGNFNALLESTFDAVIVVSSADLWLGRKWKCKICDLWERESSSVLFQQTGHIFTLHSRLQQKIVCKYWQRRNHWNLACFGCLMLIFLESNIYPLW